MIYKQLQRAFEKCDEIEPIICYMSSNEWHMLVQS